MSAVLKVKPIAEDFSLKSSIYVTLKDAILKTNIYDDEAQLKLDERTLSEQLGISRTPLREALARLEQEGLVQIVPRRGVYIVRKTKQEILDHITAWAALESMAARLACEVASDKDIRKLRKFVKTDKKDAAAHIDEYSDTNIQFHTAILKLGGSEKICEMADELFLHVRAIRARTIHDENRVQKSLVDHMEIIDAIEARNAERADRLVRQHTLNLREHVARNLQID